ncbi:MAG TPA: MaoC/PaaZ C-terminal domain-containing protein [Thermoleophilaceae bacterium]|nr:MaoC/PaaZ C-terminal domain-containing protein [Thermoleophilaceae bacterium]
MNSSPFALDFDQLQGGERFVTSGRTITETDIVQFAALTGDMHPQHTDAAWAAESRFGERIAHGMLVMSYAVGLVPLDHERVVALRRVSDVVFKHPAYIGDTIHVDGRIESLKPVDDSHGLVEALWKIVTQRGRTVARARVELLWRRNAVGAELGSELVMPL